MPSCPQPHQPPLPIFRPSYGPEKALRVMDDRLQHHGYQFARCTPLNFVLTTSWNVLLLSSIFQVSGVYVVLHYMRTKGPFIYNLFFTCLYPSKLSQAALGCVFLHFHRITKTLQNLRACCLKKNCISIHRSFLFWNNLVHISISYFIQSGLMVWKFSFRF